MPLYWMIDSKERLFTGSGEGDVTLADAMALLDAVAGAGALSYRKLFDGRAVQSSMTGEELLAVCVSIRAYHEQTTVGALAIVCTPEQTVEFARLLGALAAADRPIKMFPNLRQAHTWLGHRRT
jgi:hypothetical protein